MASFLTSIKRELNDDSEEVSESQDSFFRRDFDKLKEMLTNLKEVQKHKLIGFNKARINQKQKRMHHLKT